MPKGVEHTINGYEPGDKTMGENSDDAERR